MLTQLCQRGHEKQALPLLDANRNKLVIGGGNRGETRAFLAPRPKRHVKFQKPLVHTFM